MATSTEIPDDVKLVLVTGASGFIASHVIQQLLRSGYRVRGTVRSLKNEKKVQPIYNLCPDSKHKLELVEADLTDPSGWKSAVEGCSHILHVASPFPPQIPKDENELIKPAVEGTTNVLQACQQVGGVKRVVVTSSVVAICGSFDGNINNDHVYSEKDWPNPAIITPYEKSKTLAERAAWEFVDNLKDNEKFELAVVNPGYVVGPVLSGTNCTSSEIPRRLLNKEIPGIPALNMPVVDVRDVAKAHIIAMNLPEAVGHRHVLVAGNMWFKEMALALEKEFKPQGYNVPTRSLPKLLLQIIALFDGMTKMMVSALGKVARFDNRRMRNILGIEPISMDKSFVDMGYSLIESGAVPKKPKYKGLPSNW